jgi:hypothetical protein
MTNVNNFTNLAIAKGIQADFAQELGDPSRLICAHLLMFTG